MIYREGLGSRLTGKCHKARRELRITVMDKQPMIKI